MKMPCRAPNASVQLDYVRDTLFGPVAQSVECQCQLAALNLQGRPGCACTFARRCPTRSTVPTAWPSSGTGAATTVWSATRANAVMAA